MAGPSPIASNPPPRPHVGPSGRVLAWGQGHKAGHPGSGLQDSSRAAGAGPALGLAEGRALSMVPMRVCEAGRRTRETPALCPPTLGDSLTACSRRKRCHRSPGRGRTRAPRGPRSCPCPRCRQGRSTWGGWGAAAATEEGSADGQTKSAAQRPALCRGRSLWRRRQRADLSIRAARRGS